MISIGYRLGLSTLILAAIAAVMGGWVFSAYLVWNALVFTVYAVDKAQALRSRTLPEEMRGRARISENSLLWLAASLGGAGALLAMLLCWHKVRKPAFHWGVPVMLVAQLTFFWTMGHYGIVPPARIPVGTWFASLREINLADPDYQVEWSDGANSGTYLRTGQKRCDQRSRQVANGTRVAVVSVDRTPVAPCAPEGWAQVRLPDGGTGWIPIDTIQPKPKP